MDHGIVGGIVNDLPIEKMVAAPLVAAIQAQTSMSLSLAHFVQDVGMDESGNLRMVTLKYQQTETDKEGTPKQTDRFIQAPFLALTDIPNLAIEDINVDFNIEVSTAEEEKIKNTADSTVTTDYKTWWSPVSAKFTGSVSHSSDQTRRTDTRARYAFNVSARKQGTPEAFLRIIDAVTNAVANPVQNAPKSKPLIEKTSGQGGGGNSSGGNSGGQTK